MADEATQENKAGVSRRDEALSGIIEQRKAELEKKATEELDEPEPIEEGLTEDPGEGGDNGNIDEPEHANDGGDIIDGADNNNKIEMMTVVDENGNKYEIPRTGRITLKIDGEEQEETLDTVTRRYQKGAAGDKRLQEANEAINRLNQQSEELTAAQAAFVEQMQRANEKHADGDLSPDDYQDKVEQLINALVDADTDAAMDLLPSILPQQQRHESGTLDPNTLDQAIERKVLAINQEKELKQAISKFQDEYPDIAGDPRAYTLVDQETIAVQKENPNWTAWKIIKQAAENVKAWKGDVPLSKKPTKKKSIPTPSGGRVPVGKEDPKPKTVEDVFKEIKKARNQPLTI